MAMRGPRLAVGSKPWIAEEKASAVKLVQSEIEEFSFSAQNDFEWLNEHMAGIFDENEVNMADVFKTPGKLRGRTPRTIRKAPQSEARVPLSSIFSTTPNNGVPNNFARQLSRLQSPISKVNNPLHVKRDIHEPPPAPVVASTQSSSPGRVVPPADSGYFGSQPEWPRSGATPSYPSTPDRTIHNEEEEDTQSVAQDPIPRSPEDTFETAKAEQTARVAAEQSKRSAELVSEQQAAPQDSNKPEPAAANTRVESPAKLTALLKQSPQKTPPETIEILSPPVHHSDDSRRSSHDSRRSSHDELMQEDDAQQDDAQSASDSSSSPIHPVVRKSSLNFASLPAREPLAGNKSMGARLSRTSQLDHQRTSYYGRATGGKSLGNGAKVDLPENRDELDTDEVPGSETSHDVDADIVVDYSKTYTQRLQDRITMLGQAQPNATRSSKSIARLSAGHGQVATQVVETQAKVKQSSPTRRPELPPSTPGAFPIDEEEEDDWAVPPMTQIDALTVSPRPPLLSEYYSAGIMEDIHDKDTVGGRDFVAKTGSRPGSPARPIIPERATSIFSHHKASSVTTLPELSPQRVLGLPGSDPTMAVVSEGDVPETPSKSPSRIVRDSPLKQVKNKLSSIFKGSRGLLASSAAISAEGKTSLLSPSRIDLRGEPSTESLLIPAVAAESLYPDLGASIDAEPQSPTRTGSPIRPNTRRTRASVEKEKEERRKDKEAKKLAEQMEKLDRAREKEAEKARAYNKVKEKEKEKEAATADNWAASQGLSSSPRKEATKHIKTSSQDAKQPEIVHVPMPGSSDVDDDVPMTDAPAVTTHSQAKTVTSTPSQAPRTREPKRTLKPAKETAGKSKQAPTVIRVNMGSQNSQYHPSNNALAASLHETLVPAVTPAPSHLGKSTSKPPPPTLKAKASNQSLKSSVSSVGRPKALDIAARRKEQEEREAQRKRDAKSEMERKRAALQEEERRQEQERQKQREEAEARKNVAKRLAALEKAKQTRAPPPATRTNPNGPPDYGGLQRPEAPRPPSRMQSTMQRPQEEFGRPVNAVLSAVSNTAHKRTLSQQESDDFYGRNPQSRNGATFQGKDAKRRRTSEGGGDEMETPMPKIKGPPVRPSGGLKKDMHTKAMFTSSYTPGPQASSRDLFKTAVSGQAKASHPLDMAQVSKATIPFAQPNAHKTPARPGAMAGVVKSVAKSTAKMTAATRSPPKFPQGDAIELPEIQTDDEDSDEGDSRGGGTIAPWADSPDLRRALMQQEGLDPSAIFGLPGPLVMEEVFKDRSRWSKFRSRTSSANWNGADRLTEEEIRKDLQAMDKLRKEGGWSYQMSRDLL